MIFLLELVLLFFSSKIVISSLARIFSTVTRSHRVTIYLLAFLFFPGTVVHEMAHMLVAMILGVRVGDVELFPKINGEEVKLGSVQVARSDPFRRFFIGIAPLVVGLVIVFLILSYVGNSIPFGWLWIFAGYALFVITNTMFSSKKDMEGAWVFFVALILIVIAVIVFKIQLPTAWYEKVIGLAQTGSWLLLFPLIINGVVYLFATVIKSK